MDRLVQRGGGGRFFDSRRRRPRRGRRTRCCSRIHCLQEDPSSFRIVHNDVGENVLRVGGCGSSGARSGSGRGSGRGQRGRGRGSCTSRGGGGRSRIVRRVGDGGDSRDILVVCRRVLVDSCRRVPVDSCRRVLADRNVLLWENLLARWRRGPRLVRDIRSLLVREIRCLRRRTRCCSRIHCLQEDPSSFRIVHNDVGENVLRVGGCGSSGARSGSGRGSGRGQRGRGRGSCTSRGGGGRSRIVRRVGDGGDSRDILVVCRRVLVDSCRRVPVDSCRRVLADRNVLLWENLLARWRRGPRLVRDIRSLLVREIRCLRQSTRCCSRIHCLPLMFILRREGRRDVGGNAVLVPDGPTITSRGRGRSSREREGRGRGASGRSSRGRDGRGRARSGCSGRSSRGREDGRGARSSGRGGGGGRGGCTSRGNGGREGCISGADGRGGCSSRADGRGGCTSRAGGRGGCSSQGGGPPRGIFQRAIVVANRVVPLENRIALLENRIALLENRIVGAVSVGVVEAVSVGVGTVGGRDGGGRVRKSRDGRADGGGRVRKSRDGRADGRVARRSRRGGGRTSGADGRGGCTSRAGGRGGCSSQGGGPARGDRGRGRIFQRAIVVAIGVLLLENRIVSRSRRGAWRRATRGVSTRTPLAFLLFQLMDSMVGGRARFFFTAPRR